jgi:hypothetical protein
MSESSAGGSQSQIPVSPVLRLVTHLMQKQIQMKDQIKPQAWILELLNGLQDQISQAGLVYGSHSGGSGFAFLRDRLAGSTAEERPVTRFHSAKGFLEEAINRCDQDLDNNPGDSELTQKALMRRLLFQWIEEAETLYEQQGKPPAAKPAAKASHKPVATAAPIAEEPVPLSFLNEVQTAETKAHLEKLLRASAGKLSAQKLARQVLAELEKALVHAEPDAAGLCQHAIGSAVSLDGAVCNVFAVMSGQEISTYDRAWLSSLGSFLVQCKSDWSSLAASHPPAAAPAPAAKAPPTVGPKEQPTAAALEQSESNLGLTPKLRQQLKHTMIDAFAAWEAPDVAWSEGRCLEEMKTHLAQLGISGCLEDCLHAENFVAAQAQLAAAEVVTAQERKLQRHGKMLLQEVQTGYVQRLRQSLGMSVVLDPELRKQLLIKLVDYWKRAYQSAPGPGKTKRLEADQKTIKGLFGKLLEELQPKACREFLQTQTATASGFESLCVELAQQSLTNPLTALLRSQLKGYLEDVDLMLAFDASNRAGWNKLIVILSHQQPRSESELVAILARKIDVLRLTQVHENFLNPTLNLRLGNFITWVSSGYLMSPSYSDSPQERDLLAHLAWLLEQLAGLKMMESNEASLDAFLSEDARIGYAVFGPFLIDVGRRFEIWQREWNSNKR